MKMSVSVAQIERAAQYGPALVVGSQIIDRPDWRQIITPGLPVPEANIISRSILHPDHAVTKVMETIKYYSERKLPMWWVVGPSSRPENLSELLLQCGMQVDHEALGLAIATSKKLELPSSVHDVQVRPVDQSNLDDYWTALGKSLTPSLADWGRRMLHGEFGNIHCFVGYIDNRPAGGAAFHILDEQLDEQMAYLMSGFTLPEFRKLGVYQSLLSYRLKQLRESRIPWAVTLAKVNTSAPICLKLGFEEICRFQIFMNPRSVNQLC